MLKSPSKAAAAGCLITAIAAMALKGPVIAVCLAGVGNALFHVGGGAVCLNLKSKSAGPAGFYVAPGALGLFIGTLIGKGGHFNAWIFVIMFTEVLLIIRIMRINNFSPGYNLQVLNGLVRNL